MEADRLEAEKQEAEKGKGKGKEKGESKGEGKLKRACGPYGGGSAFPSP
jgi:hypothetical protein